MPWYADAVGLVATSVTFFVGSVFFTLGGFIQLVLSGRRPPRGIHSANSADWWSAAIQFVGTLLFNLSTLAVLRAAVIDPNPAAGWRPDAWGSAAFLLSSALAIVAASRRHELWDPLARTWHGTGLNMLGSVFFAASAVGAYVAPGSDAVADSHWADAGTFLGAVCFFLAAILARRNTEAVPPG